MRRVSTILGLIAPVAAATLVGALLFRPVLAKAQKGASLLTILSEWKYPGSSMPSGAGMSDGGNPLLQSVNCRAILTTADPIEKVIAFYSEKFGTPALPVLPGSNAEPKGADAKSVSTEDDSQGRPVTLRVIVVNKVDSSTTLVISRAKGETETHIAWLHYLRLGDKR